jgi:hypothetical protein
MRERERERETSMHHRDGIVRYRLKKKIEEKDKPKESKTIFHLSIHTSIHPADSDT